MAASDDDGFDDFLSEDEEACALQTQEMAALARKMKMVGVREALNFGKESTLQEGFDRGFREAARDAFRFSILRGALCVAYACGLTSTMDETETQEVQALMEKLRARSLRVPRVVLTDAASLGVEDGSTATAESTLKDQTTNDGDAEDDAMLAVASAWLMRLGLELPTLMT